jgi:hypothetical protein
MLRVLNARELECERLSADNNPKVLLLSGPDMEASTETTDRRRLVEWASARQRTEIQTLLSNALRHCAIEALAEGTHGGEDHQQIERLLSPYMSELIRVE